MYFILILFETLENAKDDQEIKASIYLLLFDLILLEGEENYQSFLHIVFDFDEEREALVDFDTFLDQVLY
jgi:hypothetical protein